MKNSFKSFKLFLLIISLLGLASCEFTVTDCNLWNKSIEKSAKSLRINPKVAALNEATATPLEVETTYTLHLLPVGQIPELKLPSNKEAHATELGRPEKANQSAGFFSFTPKEDGTYVAFSNAESWMNLRTAASGKLATVPAFSNSVCKDGEKENYGKVYELTGGTTYILGIYRSNRSIASFVITSVAHYVIKEK